MKSLRKCISPCSFAMSLGHSTISKGPLLGCHWPLRIVAKHRDLDFTSCFEHLVLLPAPLLVTLFVAVWQLISKKRASSAWIDRGTAGERIGRMKVVSRDVAQLTTGYTGNVDTFIRCGFGFVIQHNSILPFLIDPLCAVLHGAPCLHSSHLDQPSHISHVC